MTMTARRLLTLGNAAREAGVLESQLRSLLKRNPHLAVMVGNARCVSPDDMPSVIAALRAAGNLPPETEADVKA